CELQRRDDPTDLARVDVEAPQSGRLSRCGGRRERCVFRFFGVVAVDVAIAELEARAENGPWNGAHVGTEPDDVLGVALDLAVRVVARLTAEAGLDVGLAEVVRCRDVAASRLVAVRNADSSDRLPHRIETHTAW